MIAKERLLSFDKLKEKREELKKEEKEKLSNEIFINFFTYFVQTGLMGAY
ncbi:MAG: hypothetical protein ACJAW3_001205 [Lentimonas sp.]|jgi:hypothetical protein